LTRILRYSIGSSEHPVPLRREIEHLREYLAFYELTSDRQVVLEISTEPQVLDSLVPSMILQPLVENAILHGFASSNRRGGRVEVLGRRAAGSLLLSVKDNGVGMDAELVAQVRASLASPSPPARHIGLWNVHRRIVLLSGGQFGVQIRSEPGVGTEILLEVKNR
jgi:sensor histidine kinase YesM